LSGILPRSNAVAWYASNWSSVGAAGPDAVFVGAATDAVGAAITAEGVPNGATAAAAAGAPNSADADSMFAPPVLVPAALPAGRPKIVLELAALLPTPAPHVTPPATGAAAGCPNTLAGP